MNLIFGSIEAITPLIGWLIGNIAASYVDVWGDESWVHCSARRLKLWAA